VRSRAVGMNSEVFQRVSFNSASRESEQVVGMSSFLLGFILD
jgi:hypothetical protein